VRTGDESASIPGVTTTIVIMGVSGSGKSTVLAGLRERLGWATAEADEFMLLANVEKMRAGHALTDEDRWPWLRALAGWIGEREAAGENALMTCSALRRPYRDLLRANHPSVWFASLAVPADELRRRVESRHHEYMPASLLDSQLATLEPLGPDEPGAEVRADGAPAAVVEEILAALRSARGRIDDDGPR
jgi:gluconokinase